MQERLKAKIRDVPDFPQSGVIFKDITTLLEDGEDFRTVIDTIGDRYLDKKIDLVLVIEARGFIIGSALAYKLGAGIVLIRKPGKLPYKTYKMEYALEYGTDALEIHHDAIHEGARILIVDDLLATGGTVEAVIKLLEPFHCELIELSFLVELSFLNGRERLDSHNIFSLIQY